MCPGYIGGFYWTFSNYLRKDRQSLKLICCGKEARKETAVKEKRHYDKMLTLRMKSDLHEELKRLAAENERHLTHEINFRLKQSLSQDEQRAI